MVRLHYVFVRVSLIYRFDTSFTMNYFNNYYCTVYIDLIYLASQWPQYDFVEPCSEIGQQFPIVDDAYRIHTESIRYKYNYRDK